MNAPAAAAPPHPIAPPAGDAPLLIVINGASGHQDSDVVCGSISGMLDAVGRRHEFLRIPDPARIGEVATEAVRRARAKQGIVVAAGGDGTLNAVAQAVIGSGCAFAVLPQGTFNYFGRAHGISQDIESAVRGLLHASVEPVQVGRVNGRIFLVNASLGLYPQLLEDREAAKRQMGRSRLVALFSGLRTLMSGARQLHLDMDAGGHRRLVHTPTLFVGNNRLQLERIGIAEDVPLEHGRLAGIMVRPTSTLAMLGLALRGALGKLGDADRVQSFAFKSLTVSPRGRRRIKVAVDGEVLWMISPLVFDVSPEPLPLMMPRLEDRVEIE